MRYCNTCHITYEAPLDHCLFCNNTLSIQEEPSNFTGNYPDYFKIHHTRRMFLKILTFLVLIANIICLLIDRLQPDGKLNWSYFVLFPTLYTLGCLILLTKKGKVLKKVVHLGLLSDVLLFFIGICCGHYHWFLDYVLPISLMALNFTSTCHNFGRRTRLFDYSVYSLVLSFLGILTGLLLLTNFVQMQYGILVCLIYSAITLIAFLFFAPKSVLEELRRRLYF